MKLETLLSSTPAFAARLEEVLESLQMADACRDMKMDHICVRLNSGLEVLKLKVELEQIGSTISTANVNGRDIHIIQLEQPILVGRWETLGIELPHPKPGRTYDEGWEHVEFVIPGLFNTMIDVMRSFESHFPHLKQPPFVGQFQLKADEPEAEGDQMPNPTIGIVSAGVGVKFHARPIQEVVGYQKSPQ
tara:strand:- start:6194 stop:6763 length:570 start_codon:yes stop_codon:yes gene_type:complete